MIRFNRNEKGIQQLQIYTVSLKRCVSSIRRNHYEVLGIPSSATRAEIKKAYIEKAKKCHPDLFPDSEEKTKEFQELQEAYSVLSDTKRRAAYAQAQPNSPNRNSEPFRSPHTRFDGGFPRHSYHPNRTGMNDPLHDMFKDFRRQQWERRQHFTEEELSEAQERKKRWERIIVTVLFIYFVSIIVANNFRLERKEERRRRLSHMSDMEAGLEDAKILQKYRERMRMRREGVRGVESPEQGRASVKEVVNNSEKVVNNQETVSKLGGDEILSSSNQTAKLQKEMNK